MGEAQNRNTHCRAGAVRHFCNLMFCGSRGNHSRSFAKFQILSVPQPAFWWTLVIPTSLPDLQGAATFQRSPHFLMGWRFGRNRHGKLPKFVPCIKKSSAMTRPRRVAGLGRTQACGIDLAKNHPGNCY